MPNKSVVCPTDFYLFIYMAKSRRAKEQSLKEVGAMLQGARGIVFVDYAGLTVKEMQELRRTLSAKGVAFEVAKKTVLGRAFKSAGLSQVDVAGLNGMVSLATSGTDEVEAARELTAFAKTHEKMKLLGGVLEGAFVDAARIKELAKLPGKQELLGILVGTLQAPLAGFVNVLQGNLRGLVQVLRAAADKTKA